MLHEKEEAKTSKLKKKKISKLDPNKPKWQVCGSPKCIKFIFGYPEEITTEHKSFLERIEKRKRKNKNQSTF